ncbi:MAG: D-tyrosyl-tRNA(Tyr) deacylase [Anaerolineae bacterium]|nr:MAG: D-tyrosyl-tRNA(Tyr) deacylase [Anaerolineae bacterium]
MRVLLQRVSFGRVSVNGKTLGEIGQGVVLLVGVTHDDGEAQIEYLANKIANLRIFEDEAGKLNRSLLDIGGEALVISQFTLYADTRKGRRPSFTAAARPEHADPLIRRFTEALQTLGVPAQSGQFGAHMLVEIHNDGPVTIWLER